MTRPDWIALDWGTSRVRAWAMSASGAVLASVQSERGMNQLDPADFEPVLREMLSAWLPASGAAIVIGCGMLGSRQGWIFPGDELTRAGLHAAYLLNSNRL